MWSAADVLALRQRLELSDAQFSRLVGVNVLTVRRWEASQRTPTGQSLAILNAFQHKLDQQQTAEQVAAFVGWIHGTVTVGGLAYLLIRLLSGYSPDKDGAA